MASGPRVAGARAHERRASNHEDTMKTLRILGCIATLGLIGASTLSAQTATQTVTFQVDAINQISVAGTPSLLVSQLNHDLMYGSMSAGMNATLTNMVTNVSIDPTTRVTSALQVLLASPEFSIQK